MQNLKNGVVLNIHIPEILYRYVSEALAIEPTANGNLTVDVFCDTDQAQIDLLSFITKAVVDKIEHDRVRASLKL